MNGLSYWLSWIENGSDGLARAGFKSDCYLTLEKAVEEMERVRDGDKVVCAWIDCFGPSNEKIGTPVMECYINSFGDREMWRFKQRKTTFADRYNEVIASGKYDEKRDKVVALAQLIYANDRSRDKEDCLVQALEEYEDMTGAYWDPTHEEYGEALASII